MVGRFAKRRRTSRCLWPPELEAAPYFAGSELRKPRRALDAVETVGLLRRPFCLQNVWSQHFPTRLGQNVANCYFGDGVLPVNLQIKNSSQHFEGAQIVAVTRGFTSAFPLSR
jgi:hypothetical protein